MKAQPKLEKKNKQKRPNSIKQMSTNVHPTFLVHSLMSMETIALLCYMQMGLMVRGMCLKCLLISQP